MRHSGCERFDLHCAHGQRRKMRKALRGDVIAKDKHRRPLVADDGHDIGLAEFSELFFERADIQLLRPGGWMLEM